LEKEEKIESILKNSKHEENVSILLEELEERRDEITILNQQNLQLHKLGKINQEKFDEYVLQTDEWKKKNKFTESIANICKK